MNYNKHRILNVDVNRITYIHALDKIGRLAKKRSSGYVCFVNVHMTIEAQSNPEFAGIVNAATLALPDGKPIATLMKVMYGFEQERIAGMDFLPDLIKMASNLHFKLFFFGSTELVLQNIKRKVNRNYPNIEIVGMISPPFDKPLDDNYYISYINSCNPDLVLVALGCPKQESWMAKNSKYINATLLGVGGAFSVYAGMTKRAPLWMQNFSLEWLYRLLQEPGRMWRRYLTTNTLFIYLVLRQLIQKNHFNDVK